MAAAGGEPTLAHERGAEGEGGRQVGARRPPDHRLGHRHVKVMLVPSLAACANGVVPPAARRRVRPRRRRPSQGRLRHPRQSRGGDGGDGHHCDVFDAMSSLLGRYVIA